MQLGKAPVYAILATLYVAKNGSRGPIQGRTIADAYGIPAEYLLKILQQLARAQIVQSERGPRGGFRLRKLPAETTLLEIVEAVDGAISGELRIHQSALVGERMTRPIEKLCRDSAHFTRDLLRRASIELLIDSESAAPDTARPGSEWRDRPPITPPLPLPS